MQDLYFEYNEITGFYFYNDINELSDNKKYEWYGKLEFWHLSRGIPAACQGVICYEEAQKIADENGANEGKCNLFA